MTESSCANQTPQAKTVSVQHHNSFKSFMQDAPSVKETSKMRSLLLLLIAVSVMCTAACVPFVPPPRLHSAAKARCPGIGQQLLVLLDVLWGARVLVGEVEHGLVHALFARHNIGGSQLFMNQTKSTSSAMDASYVSKVHDGCCVPYTSRILGRKKRAAQVALSAVDAQPGLPFSCRYF
jgi:hypothetical protein